MTTPAPPALPAPPAVVTSLIRTWSPMVAGWLIGLPLARPVLALFGIDTPTAQRVGAGAVAVVAGAVYYGVVRWAESRWPAVGRLLGRAAAPAYPTTAAPGAERLVDGFSPGRPTGNVRRVGDDLP
jgi:hypothetical protein